MPSTGNQTISSTQKAALEFAFKFLTLPTGYVFQDVHGGTHNKKPIWIFRYGLTQAIEAGGTHFSFTVTESPHRLLGFTWMSENAKKGQSLPSKEAARAIAIEFLNRIEPEFASTLENLWIEPHDEPVLVNGRHIIVTGMKYKCYRPAHDDYAWVIVGPSNQVITFEREIQWIGGRITEKWLHDSFRFK